MFGYVYITTNLINGRKYIGKHKSENTEDSYIGSGIALTKAIRKYGRENFKKEVLYICETAEELTSKEIELILKHDAIDDPLFYNMFNAGAGGHYNLTKEELSRMGKERWNNLPEEERQNRTKILVERVRSEENRKKVSKAKKGKPRIWKSDDTKKAYSERRKEEVANGIAIPPPANRGNRDFRHSTESKQLMKEKVAKARERIFSERDSYCTEEGKQQHKIKLEQYYTDEVRKEHGQKTNISREVSSRVRKEKANEYVKKIFPIILELRENKKLTWDEVANSLNEMGYLSPRKKPWIGYLLSSSFPFFKKRFHSLTTDLID